MNLVRVYLGPIGSEFYIDMYLSDEQLKFMDEMREKRKKRLVEGNKGQDYE